MKRIIALASVLVLACALVACANSELLVESDDTGIHAVAQNRAEGSANGDISIAEGSGLCINHIVEKGSFHVKATDEQGTVVFDEEISDNIADLVPVTGDIEVIITAKKATGTIDIIAYDVEAQAAADESLPEALESVGVDAAESGLLASPDDAGAAEATDEAAAQ